jgi:hypothetical protein
MSWLASPAEALRCFREIDRPEVDLDKLRFPLQLEHYLAWTSGPRAFLLFAEDDRPPLGIVFHRSTAAMPDVAAMCEWCHAVRAHGAVKLLSVSTDARHHVGLWLCADLGCIERTRALPAADDLREHPDAEERIRRILRRIASFAARRLGASAS